MALNGEAGQAPLKFGVAAVDLFTGQYAAQAVLAALYQRSRTGKGRRIELSLFDCGVAITSYYGLEALVQGKDPPRYGNAHPSIVPYGVFEAADGPLLITVGNNARFHRFCTRVVERQELLGDARFATNLERSRNRALLIPVIEEELRKRRRSQLLQVLRQEGIPVGEVLGLHEALVSPRTEASGMVARFEDGGATRWILAPPYRFDGCRLPVRSLPPPLQREWNDA